MVTGPEVEDHVERIVGKGHVSYIGFEQLRFSPARVQVPPSADQESAVHVEAREASRRAEGGQGHEGIGLPAPHLEDPLGAREVETANNQGNLHLLLPGVAASQNGKGDVVGDNRLVPRAGSALHSRPPCFSES